MQDQYGRTIDYVRISITDRCNLRCCYCMPKEGVEQLTCQDILSYEEIVRAAEVMALLGVRKIKITGGEPLVRRQAAELIKQLKAVKGIEQVTLTTNGVLLSEQAEALLAAGVDGINISLDTLDADAFARLTRRDALPQVLAGVERLMTLGYQAVKVNCVPLAGVNEEQICALAALAKKWPIAVRFIELMPLGLGRTYQAIAQETIQAQLTDCFGPPLPWSGQIGNGPAQYETYAGFAGQIGYIGALHDKFCTRCNRVRLTATGYLKLCLQYDVGADIRPWLQKEVPKAAAAEAIRQVIYQKPMEHHFEQTKELDHTETRKMFQIGG